MVISSTAPRFMPAQMPSGVPISTAMPTETTPTSSVMRAPTRMRENRSRPRLSVPSQCAALGSCSLAGGSIRTGS